MPERGDHDESANGSNQPPPHHWTEFFRRYWWLLLLLLFVNWFIVSLVVSGGTTEARTSIPYSFFHHQVVDDNVAEVTTTGDSITGRFRHAVPYPKRSESKVSTFESERPAFSNDHLVQQLLGNGVMLTAEPESSGTSWTEIIVAFLPTVLIVGLLLWVFRRGMAGAG
ncbi:MAG TPA: ATP-dependent metallopeptidase FtsH/Yme1/Tma family protein, partial [Acidimicrobiia bacterium]